jgi:hypothetical protein
MAKGNRLKAKNPGEKAEVSTVNREPETCF